MNFMGICMAVETMRNFRNTNFGMEAAARYTLKNRRTEQTRFGSVSYIRKAAI